MAARAMGRGEGRGKHGRVSRRRTGKHQRGKEDGGQARRGGGTNSRSKRDRAAMLALHRRRRGRLGSSDGVGKEKVMGRINRSCMQICRFRTG